jgi:hypothetical protein
MKMPILRIVLLIVVNLGAIFLAILNYSVILFSVQCILAFVDPIILRQKQ